ncbi:hypothetical protein ACFQ9U_11385 [Streptomyces sp. NPDC056568]|uniref:hypothetical protein n=1 Tax=Streptomyces sp. NPDC056568 TaxID=3345866 RepID=UPI0036909688
MSGGQQRYWNEAAQRWEDAAGSATPATPPPPPRPEAVPRMPPVPGPDAGPCTTPVPPPGHAPWSAPELPHPAPLPPGPAPSSGGGTGPSRRLVWSVLGGAAAVGAVVALVLTLVVPGDEGGDDDGRAAGPASASATEPSALRSGETTGTGGTGDAGETPAPPEESSPAAEGTGLPDGYELHADPEGFTLARPEGWVRDAVPSQYGMSVVNHRSPDGRLRLQVYQVAEATPTASFDLFLSEETPKGPGFRELSLTTPHVGEVTATRLEYLVDSIRGEPDVGTWHVVDERFLAPDGQVYAIAAYGADADGREDERELLDTARAAFCPPHTTCDTPGG